MSTSKTSHQKMDPRLIAAGQPHEITYVRLIFYKESGSSFMHPGRDQIMAMCKKYNNSRIKVYESLAKLGYTKIKRPS